MIRNKFGSKNLNKEKTSSLEDLSFSERTISENSVYINNLWPYEESDEDSSFFEAPYFSEELTHMNSSFSEDSLFSDDANKNSCHLNRSTSEDSKFFDEIVDEPLDPSKMSKNTRDFLPYFENLTTMLLFCWMQKHNISTSAYDDLADIMHDPQFNLAHVIKNKLLKNQNIDMAIYLPCLVKNQSLLIKSSFYKLIYANTPIDLKFIEIFYTGDFIYYQENIERLERIRAIVLSDNVLKLKIQKTIEYHELPKNLYSKDRQLRAQFGEKISLNKLDTNVRYQINSSEFESELLISYQDFGYTAALINTSISFYESVTYFAENDYGIITKWSLNLDDTVIIPEEEEEESYAIIKAIF
ncbi:21968_t:CDS:2 [Gigaspora rosea]|nr:21968_t:CDS:2 [Gigaspora rosea]